MKPHAITFYVYADDERQARDLEAALYDFVLDCYHDGRAVTASRLAQAVRKYGNGPLVKNYFNGRE